MTWPKHYSLMKEHPKHFELHDARDNKTFHVAKKDLHPANQIKVMQMKKFAEGGEVPVSMPDPQKAREAWAGAQAGQSLSKGWQNLKNEFGFGSSQQPKKMADGGDVAPDAEEPFLTRAGEYVGKIGSQALSDATAPVRAIGNAAGQFLGGLGKGADISPSPVVQPQAAMNNSVPQTSAPAPAEPSAQPQATALPQTDYSQFPTAKGLQGLQNQYADQAMQEVEATKKQNDQMAELQQMHAYALQNSQKVYDEKMQDSQQRVDQLSQDIASSKVDPNRYWESKNTGNKIASIVGIIFGGIGQGLSGGTSNMAWDALQKNIDRDVQSQKENIGLKQNLLSENLRIQGNLMQAETATRLQMGAVVQGQIAKIAASTNDPILRSQIQQKLIQMREAQIPLQQSLAAGEAERVKRQQMLSMMQGKDISHVDPAQLVETIVPEHNRKKVYEEIEAAQNTKKMGGSILDSFEQAAKENTVLKTGGGYLRTPGSVLALHQAMQPTFKDLEGTVRQAAMENTFKNVTPAPGDSEHKIAQKRQALTEYLQSKMSAPTAKGSGLDLSKFESTKSHDYTPPPVMRQTSDGRIGLFDPTTKKFLGYK